MYLYMSIQWLSFYANLRLYPLIQSFVEAGAKIGKKTKNKIFVYRPLRRLDVSYRLNMDHRLKMRRSPLDIHDSNFDHKIFCFIFPFSFLYWQTAVHRTSQSSLLDSVKPMAHVKPMVHVKSKAHVKSTEGSILEYVFFPTFAPASTKLCVVAYRRRCPKPGPTIAVASHGRSRYSFRPIR